MAAFTATTGMTIYPSCTTTAAAKTAVPART
jgi:hypothetical protein